MSGSANGTVSVTTEGATDMVINEFFPSGVTVVIQNDTGSCDELSSYLSVEFAKCPSCCWMEWAGKVVCA